VQAVLAARIDRLPPEAKHLLQTAAVIGTEVPVPLLQAIAEAPDEIVQRSLAQLQAAEFLYETRLFPEREYTFKHALTHEVAYGSLLLERRRTLHARIVASLEALAGEGAPLNWRPSADAVAGNGPDGPAPTQSRQRHRKVILLSDGEANMGIVDPKELAKIAASFTSHSAVLSTIGMGLGFNETLMAMLADYGMGHYAYLEHLEKLGEILEQDMADTRQVFASASSLEITCGDGITVTDVGGYPIDLTAQPGMARVSTGQLLGSATKHFVVTMTVPTDRVGEIGLGNVTLHYTTSQGTSSIALSPEHLRIAVLEPARRDEATASVHRELLQQLWGGNNLGRLQKDYSHWLRAGEKQKAQQAITDYRQALQKAATDTGVRVENQAVTDKLSTMEQELNEAFSGPAAQQEEKRKRAAKIRHGESLKSQRSQ
jgi:hypothetical protein